MKAFTSKQLDLFLLTKVHLENADSTESSYYSSQLRSCFLPKSQPDGCNFDLKVSEFLCGKMAESLPSSIRVTNSMVTEGLE